MKMTKWGMALRVTINTAPYETAVLESHVEYECEQGEVPNEQDLVEARVFLRDNCLDQAQKTLLLNKLGPLERVSIALNPAALATKK